MLGETLPAGSDQLAEATNGRLHWDDPGMDGEVVDGLGFELEMKVEVRTEQGWRTGVIKRIPVNGFHEFIIVCDKPYSGNRSFYDGRGATIPAIDNTVRGVLSNLRLIG